MITKQADNISFDQFQRYKTVGNLINFFRQKDCSQKFKVLELGSNEHKDLGLFLPDDNILYTDINLTDSMKADPDFKELDGTELNLPDNSFDFVVALDVLEHIPEEKRKSFLENVNRVARKGAVISFPYNNNLVCDTEKRVNSFYKTVSGSDFVWLKEHIENGLPDINRTKDIVKEYPYFLIHHGSIDIWEKMWYCHFHAALSQETIDFREKIDHFYNTELYHYDNKGTCYRAFLILAKENKSEWELYSNSIFSSKEISEDKIKKLDLLSGSQNIASNLCKFNDVFEKLSNISLEFKDISLEIKDISNRKEKEIDEINRALFVAEKEKKYLSNDLIEYKKECDELRSQTELLRSQVFDYEHAFFWRITKPLRILATGLKKIIKSNKYTLFFAKGLRYLYKNGISSVFQKLKNRKAILKSTFYTAKDLTLQRKTKFDKDIKFSILVPLYNTPKKFLQEMIKSVQNQTYSNWELCFADGSDEVHKYVEEICLKFANKDNRIKYKKLTENLGISENTNACIEMATGDYIALLDHDDVLHSSALFENMKVICNKGADFIYTDEATFEGNLYNIILAHYKPDFAIDNLRANNYICHFTVFKKSLLNEAGIFRKEFNGSQDHDMVLRLTEKAKNIIHIPKILYYWRSHKASVASDISSKIYAIKAGINAVKDHLKRCNLDGEVESSKILPTIYRIKYKLKGNPLVSILIPNKDHVEDLNRCIKSIFDKSTYKNFEIIIIENNSEEKETFDYYEMLKHKEKINIVTFEGEFNYSEINNFGAKFAKGDHIILLNNDTEVISENWIEEMLMYSQREDVGAVGAKLYFLDNTIQHAGVILGLGGVAGHSHQYYNYDNPGYMGRLWFSQNYSAVTAACMMIPRHVFEKVNGLDALFKVAFNDVDLCMRIRKAGYKIVWTPYAELYHYESKSRGREDTPVKQRRFQDEVNNFKKRWAEELEEGDPFYNPNFTLDRNDFSIKLN